MVLVQTKLILILVVWSNADNKKRHFILRASLALEGRSLTLQCRSQDIHVMKMVVYHTVWMSADRNFCSSLVLIAEIYQVVISSKQKSLVQTFCLPLALAR